MAKFEIRLKARALRAKGKSIIKIAKKFGIAKSTVSIWCDDIVLTEQQKKQLSYRDWSGPLMGAAANKKKKMDAIKNFNQEGLKYIGKLSARDLTLISIALYWSEGSKGRGVFSFVNSDPFMIKCICKWLREDVALGDEYFIPRVAINEMHKPRIGKVLRFWSNLLRLPRGQFRSTFFIRNVQKKIYENYDNYFGTLVLRVKKSTNLKYKILGLIEGIKNNLPR